MKGNTKGSSALGGAKAAVWGLAAFTLIFGLALTGCPTDSDGDGGGGGGGDTISLSGTTWVQTGNGFTLSLAFTAIGWTRTMNWTGQAPGMPETGTYSVSGSTITFSGGTLEGATATVAGTTLTLTANGMTGTFIKQSGENPGGENPGGENPSGENPGGENPGSVPAALQGTWSTDGRSLTFTASEVTAVVDGSLNVDESTTWTASVSGNTITLTGTGSTAGISGSVTYSIAGTTLTITSHSTKVKLHEAFVGIGASTRDYTRQ